MERGSVIHLYQKPIDSQSIALYYPVSLSTASIKEDFTLCGRKKNLFSISLNLGQGGTERTRRVCCGQIMMKIESYARGGVEQGMMRKWQAAVGDHS